VSWGPYSEGQVSASNRVQKKAAKFANNTNESGWKFSAQRRLITPMCAVFRTQTRRRVWKAIEDRLLNLCYLSTDDYNRKIGYRKQRTNVRKYSFVNRTIESCNQLPASLLASFPCQLNMFRSGVKNVVTSKDGS
jgi:hypothetical protein